MFGKNKTETEILEKKIIELEKKLEELNEKYEIDLKLLRRQFAGFVKGYPPTPYSIENGLPYSEISKEEILEFIEEAPDLLILDVRGDEGWNSGHIPEAKHIPASQVFSRLDELSDKERAILIFCPNGNTSVTVAQMLAREGYRHVYNALGGMAGYTGKLVRPKKDKLNEKEVEGEDRDLIRHVLEVIDRDIRPGLKRDGGDLKVLSVEEGIVRLKMVGACVGCGAQKRTVEMGIKAHLTKLIPQVKGVEDLS